jgi:hypothetical protein
MFARYTSGRASSFVHRERCNSTLQLFHVVYQSPLKPTLAPLAPAPTATCDCELLKFDPGVPNFIWAQEYCGDHDMDRVDMVLPASPTLSKEPSDSAFASLSEAIEICKFIPNSSDPCADRDAKAQKRKLLHDMKPVFTATFLRVMPVSLVNSFFDMFAKNVFRALPHINRRFFASSIEPSVMDREWPHLSPLYDLLLAYMSVCPKDPRFNLDFEMKMLSQLQAPDGNERDLVAAFFMKYAEANPDREPELWMKMAQLLS